jgi:serine/threonine-protein kinase RsbT
LAVISEEIRIHLHTERDVVLARQQAKQLGETIGLTGTDAVIIATAVSEIGRNAVVYAGEGEALLRIVHAGRKRGIQIEVSDHGPGIPDVSLAMQDGFTTGGSLGLGLPGARRLMDDFEVESQVGQGTTVTMCKWVLG